MRKILFVGVALLALVPGQSKAQSVFDGTWKIDVGKAQMPKKPDVYLLQNGRYDCRTCAPPIHVRANGMDQSVTGHPYYDTVAVEVVDDHTIRETDKKAGRVVVTSTVTIAADGKTGTFAFSDSSDTNAAPVTGKGTITRVAEGPAGSHAVSGSWRTTGFATMSDNALMVTYKSTGDSLTMTSPTGQSYTAKMDGTDAPYQGDPGISSVSLQKMGANKMEETDKRHGKTITVATMSVSPDGKVMTIDVHDRLRGTTSAFVATKQ